MIDSVGLNNLRRLPFRISTLQVSEPVPEGINIFNIMNLSAPSNVSLFRNWTILVKPNSSMHQDILGQFQVREELNSA